MIDTSTWKEFRVGDYFEVTYGTFKAKSESVDEGGTPHITTTQYNNGIGYYVKEQMFPAHCITVASDGCQGASFYHTYPISASNIVSVCVPHDDVPMNETIGNFLCSLFRKEGEKYSWGGFKYSVDRVRETRLHLPATSDGQPDWDYMKSYMKAVMEESEKSLENLRKDDDTKHLIDVSGWGEFKLSNLFTKKTMKGYPKKAESYDEVENGYHIYGQNIGWQYPYKVLMDEQYLHKVEPDKPILAYTSSVGEIGLINESFYRSGDNGAFQGLFPIGYHPNLLQMQFVLSILKKEFEAFRYDTSMQNTMDITFKLPITSTGEPDWQYMEDYMRRIMDKSEQIISDLQIGA